MSSWDRARYIPWSKLPAVSSTDEGYDTQKERVFRSLQKEANREKELLGQSSSKAGGETQTKGQDHQGGFVPPEIAESRKKKGGLFNSGVDYETPDLLRALAFGGCIGSITGSVFGFMDGMKTASENKMLKNASNMAKTKYLMQGTTRSGMTFGLFFGGFHCLKYGIRVVGDPGQVSEILGAGVVSVGAMMVKPATRASIPYAGMLVAMDSFSLYMREEK